MDLGSTVIIQSSIMADSTDTHVEQDDAVEYWIFPDLSLVDCNHSEKLEERRVQCFSVLNQHLESYIWHEEGINLVVQSPTQGKQKIPPHSKW